MAVIPDRPFQNFCNQNPPHNVPGLNDFPDIPILGLQIGRENGWYAQPLMLLVLILLVLMRLVLVLLVLMG